MSYEGVGLKHMSGERGQDTQFTSQQPHLQCYSSITTIHFHFFIIPKTVYLLNNSHSPLPPIPWYLYSTFYLPIIGNSYKWNHTIPQLSFCVCFISPRVMFSRFNHVFEFHSFLKLTNIPLQVYTTLYPSIPPSINFYVVSTFQLL